MPANASYSAWHRDSTRAAAGPKARGQDAPQAPARRLTRSRQARRDDAVKHFTRRAGVSALGRSCCHDLDQLDTRGLLNHAARPQAEPPAPMAKTEFLLRAQSVRWRDDRRGALLRRHFGEEEDRLGCDPVLLGGLVDRRDHDWRELLHAEFEMLRIVGKDPAYDADEHRTLVLRLDRDDLADVDRWQAPGHVVQREPARALVEDD